MMTLDYYLHCLLTVCAAVAFSGILSMQGMLLAPLFAQVRAWYWVKYNADPDHSMWLKPLLLCPVCVSGQWALWAYLWHYHAAYSFTQHVYFVSIALFFALFLSWLIQKLS